MMISKDAVRLVEHPAATPDHAIRSSHAMVLANSQGIVVAPVDVHHQPVLQSPPPLTSPTIETSILGREQMLQELGFDSQYINDGWIKEFHALAAYLRAYGEIPEGPLKDWVNVQMQHRNQHVLTRYQEQLLVELGVFCGPLSIGGPQVPKIQEESLNVVVEAESTQVFCAEIQDSDKGTEDATEAYSPPLIALCAEGKFTKKIYCRDPSCINDCWRQGVCVRHGATLLMDVATGRWCEEKFLLKNNRRPCFIDGCQSYSRRNGVCVRHGASRGKCRFNSGLCKNVAVKNGVCTRHGATRIRKKCHFLTCDKMARKGGVCRFHEKQNTI